MYAPEPHGDCIVSTKQPITLKKVVVRAKRVSNCYLPPQKSVLCACVRLILVLVWKSFVRVFACVRLILVLVGGRQTATVLLSYVRIMYHIRMYLVSAGYPDTYMIPGTRHVCTWYQPATQIRMYLASAGRRTFRPLTRTSDDSYMYQLSLVVATAAVSFIHAYIHTSFKKGAGR